MSRQSVGYYGSIPEEGNNVENQMDSDTNSMGMDSIYQNNSLNYVNMDNYLMFSPGFDSEQQIQPNPMTNHGNQILYDNHNPLSSQFLFNNQHITSSNSSIRQTYPGPHVQFALASYQHPGNTMQNSHLNPVPPPSKNSTSPKNSTPRRRTPLAGNRASSAPSVSHHLNSLEHPNNLPQSPEMTAISPENSEDGMSLSSSTDDLSSLLHANNLAHQNAKSALKNSNGSDKNPTSNGRGRNSPQQQHNDNANNNNSNSNSLSPLKGRAGGNRTVQEMFLWERMKTPQLQKLSTLFKSSDPPQNNANHPNRRVETVDRPSKLRKTASEEAVIDYESYISQIHPHAHLTTSLSDPSSINHRPERRLVHSSSFNLRDVKDEDDWESSSDSLHQPDVGEAFRLDNPNNKLVLKEQPNFLQRKCYANENRYLLPNPMIIGLKDGTPKMGGSASVKEGYVTVSLVDNQGRPLNDHNIARLESTTGSLVKKFDLQDGTAALSLKLHCFNNQNRFRLMFECEYQMEDGNPQRELILSDPFQVHSNKSIASRCPKMWDILPKEAPSNKTTEVWIKGKDFHSKGVVVTFDGKEAVTLDITPTLVSVRCPQRDDLKESKIVEVKVWNQFSNKLVNAQEVQSFTYTFSS